MPLTWTSTEKIRNFWVHRYSPRHRTGPVLARLYPPFVQCSIGASYRLHERVIVVGYDVGNENENATHLHMRMRITCSAWHMWQGDNSVARMQQGDKRV